MTYEFSRAVNEVRRSVYVAIGTENGKVCYLFPFEFANVTDKMLQIASRVGADMSDRMGGIGSVAESILLSQVRKSITAIRFSHYALEDSGALACPENKVRTGWRLILDKPIEDYFELQVRQHKKRFANMANRKRKLVSDFGELKLRTTTSVGPSQIESVIRLKRLQFRRTGAKDIFDPFAERLLKVLARSMNSNMSLVYSELYSGNTVFAVHLGIRHGKLLHYWFPAYLEEFGTYSPGLLMLDAIIRALPSYGLGQIDFGEGDSEYKRMFGNCAYKNLHTFSNRRDLRGYLARLGEAFIWRLRA